MSNAQILSRKRSHCEENVVMAKISRLEKKLEICMDKRNSYEAHQIFRTLYFRLSSQNQFSQLFDLLYNGVHRFLQIKETAIATDLAELFVDSLIISKRPINATILDRVESIFSQIPPFAVSKGEKDDKNVDQRAKFLNGALKWSKIVAKDAKSKMRGHPELHKRFAVVYWNESNFVSSREHFLLSNDGDKFATFLFDLQRKMGFKSEIDLFIAQAILQLLSLEMPETAKICFYKYVDIHPDIEVEPPYHLPLLNFIWLLLLFVETKKVRHFCALIENYQSSLNRDPTYTEYLDKIGQLYFGLPEKVKNSQSSFMGGMLGNLLKNFMNADELSDSGATSNSETNNEFVTDDDTNSLQSYETPRETLTTSKITNDVDLD